MHPPLCASTVEQRLLSCLCTCALIAKQVHNRSCFSIKRSSCCHSAVFPYPSKSRTVSTVRALVGNQSRIAAVQQEACADTERQPFVLDLEENAQQLAACSCRNSAQAEGLPLFGEFDHVDAEKASETSDESCKKSVACSQHSLVLRSVQLCAFFAPFICMGMMLLLLAALVRNRSQNFPPDRRDQQHATAVSRRGAFHCLRFRWLAFLSHCLGRCGTGLPQDNRFLLVSELHVRELSTSTALHHAQSLDLPTTSSLQRLQANQLCRDEFSSLGPNHTWGMHA